MKLFSEQDRADLISLNNQMKHLLSLMNNIEQRLPNGQEKVYLRSSMDFVASSNIDVIEKELSGQTLTAYQLFGSLAGFHRGLAEISSYTVGYDPAIVELVSNINQMSKRCMVRASA